MTEPAQLPAKREEHQLITEYIPVEVTLELYGYFDAGYKRRYPGKGSTPTSKTVEVPGGKAKIVPPAEYGYPNTTDKDFKRAFERIVAKRLERRTTIDEHGATRRRPHLKVPISFTVYELITEAGLADNGHNYKAAIQWVKRNTATMIEAPFLDVPRGQTLTLNTHLFRQSWTPGETLATGAPADKIFIIPEGWFLSHLAHNKTLLVDHAFYKQLAGFTIAKTIVDSLAVGFRKANPWRKSYRAICDAYALRFYPKPSDRERKTAPDFWQLHRLGYIEGGTKPCTIDTCPKTAPHGRGWDWQHNHIDSVIAFYPGPKFLADQAAHQLRVSQAEQITNGTPVTKPIATAGGETLTFAAVDVADTVQKFTTAAVQITHEDRNRGFWRSRIRVLVEAGCAALVEKMLKEVRTEANHPGKVLTLALERTIDARGLRDQVRQYATPYQPPALSAEDVARDRRHREELADGGIIITPHPTTRSGPAGPIQADARDAARHSVLRSIEARGVTVPATIRSLSLPDLMRWWEQQQTATQPDLTAAVAAPPTGPLDPTPPPTTEEPDPAPAGARPPGPALGSVPST